MKGIIKVEDFYRSLKESIYDNIISAGHFDVVKVADLPMHQGKPAGYLRHSYYKISLVYGHSKIHYPTQSFEINGAALVFTNPKTPYQWERISSNQEGHVCIFTKEFLMPLANPEDFAVYQAVESAVIMVDNVLAEKLDTAFTDMTKELAGNYRLKYDLLRFMLLEMLHQGQKIAPHPAQQLTGSNANERIAISFLELLERQFPIENSLQQAQFSSPGKFAEALNVHVNHLNKALREITGNSTSTLINNRFMIEAKNLLKGSTWAINEISQALGFEEPNHFSTFFKRHQGVTPNQFRSARLVV